MWDPRMAPEVERVIGAGAPEPLRPTEAEAPPSVVINPHSELGKELRKWEQHFSHLVPPGTNPGNPYRYQPYPRMLYKADRGENGQPACVLPSPHPWNYPNPQDLERAQLAQENWNKGHQRIVRNEEEERIAKGQGWTNSPTTALELYEQQQKDIAEAAAQAAFRAVWMSDLARAELKDADASTDAHVVDVQPVRKGWPKGKKRKAVTGTGPVEE